MRTNSRRRPVQFCPRQALQAGRFRSFRLVSLWLRFISVSLTRCEGNVNDVFDVVNVFSDYINVLKRLTHFVTHLYVLYDSMSELITAPSVLYC